jgi:probable F420-dependent oxidoreductase
MANHLNSLSFGTIFRSPGYGADLGELSPWIEELGYDGIWFNETVLGRGPHIDALACLSAAAACTERITLGTAILLLPLHHPVLLAKEVSQIDIISGGRLVLGVGVGGEWRQSFDVLGVDLPTRGARANESIEILKKLWSDTSVAHHGDFFRFDEVHLEPPPVQPGGPPIWVGGRPWGKNNSNLASLRRTATLGDGWLPYLVTPETYREAWAKIGELAEQAGRDHAQIRPGLVLMITVAQTREEARSVAVAGHKQVYQQEFEHLVDRYDVFGTPEDCIRGIQRFVDAGVRDFVLQWRCPLGQMKESLETVATSVLPAFR